MRPTHLVAREMQASSRSLGRMHSDPTRSVTWGPAPALVRRRRHALVILIGLLLLVAGCSGGSSSNSDQASSSTTVPGAVETPIHVDPAVPISSPVGREFAIMLPADPGSGWRWILSPIDNTRLIALGSHFSDDAQQLLKAETATTTTTAVVPTTIAPTATTSSSTTTAPPVLPLVQIISFAGRAVGPTSITFQYAQIAGAPDAQNRVVTFSVDLVAAPTPTTTR